MHCTTVKITFDVLLTVHHAVILGNVQLDAQIPFNVFIYLQLSACFEHVVLIIRRGKLYQYSFCQLSLRVDDCVVCWLGVD